MAEGLPEARGARAAAAAPAAGPCPPHNLEIFRSPRNPTPTLYLTGKVVVDDGTELGNAASIQTSCRGSAHTAGYTDSKGNFSIELDPNARPNTSAIGDVTDTNSTVRDRSDESWRTPGWNDCQIRALLAGYTSQVVDLASRINGENRADIGNIVLHRIGQVEGFTISATTAAAPPKAKKDFEKGLSLEKKKDWPGAEQKFRSAVDIYPKYAVAWVEMGRAQMNQGREAEAKQALHKAMEADSQFMPAYEEMAEITASRERMERPRGSHGTGGSAESRELSALLVPECSG